MSRWYDKLTGERKGRAWRRYRTPAAQDRAAWQLQEPQPRPYLRTELTTYARSLIKLKKVGAQLEGRCPACEGKLIVGRERWRCLGCAVQEETGSDLAGMREFLSRCPNAAQQSGDVPRKG